MAAGVTIDFTANVAAFSKKIDKLGGDLNRFGKRADASFGLAKKAFAGLVGAFAVGRLKNEFQSIVDFGDRLQKLSLRLGDSVENLSRLQHVAQLSGVSFETMTMGLQRMTRRIAEASKGTGEAVKALKELGLSAAGLNRLSQTQQFKALADALSKVENSADRVRLAMKLFDSEGVALLQAMKNGSNGIEEMLRASDRLGNTLSTTTANEMAEFNDKLTQMGASFTGIKNKIVSDALPALNQFLNLIHNAPASIADMEKELQKLETRLESLGGRRGARHGRDAIAKRFGDLKSQLLFAKIDKGDIDALDQVTSILDVKIAKLQDKLSTLNKPTGPKLGRGESEYTRINKELKTFIEQRDALIEKVHTPVADDFIKAIQSGPEQQATVKLKPVSDKKIYDEYEAIFNQGLKLAERQRKEMADTQQRLMALFKPDLTVLTQGLENAYQARDYGIINQDQFAAETTRLAQVYNDSFINPATQRLQEIFNPDLTHFKQRMAEVSEALNLGVIGEDRAKIEFDKLGKAYNQRFIEPASEATERLSVFADQAARNMQSSFADFLFDPFQEGMNGMLEGFINTIRRMAAEYAASELFRLFTAKDSGGLGIANLVVTGLSTALGSFGSFGGSAGSQATFNVASPVLVAHQGGIAGLGGVTRQISPALFAGAERLHNGGFPGLRHDEVPAILQRGERVLPKGHTSNSGDTNMTVTTHVEVSGGTGSTENSRQLGQVINAAIKQKLVDEKRPGGLLS